jgi:hypothetical protein
MNNKPKPSKDADGKPTFGHRVPNQKSKIKNQKSLTPPPSAPIRGNPHLTALIRG